MAAATPSHAHSTINLLSLNLDVLSEILLFLSPRDAHLLALTSRESYSVAIRRALSRVVVSSVRHAELFFSCVLSYAPEKLLLIQDLRFDVCTDVEEEHASFLGDLLTRIRNVKCLHLADSDLLLYFEPRIGEGIAALPNIVELELTEGGEYTYPFLSDLCSKPLRLAHASEQSWADHTPLFTSPALRELEFLSLRSVGQDTGIPTTDINHLQFLALRVLRLADVDLPMDMFVYSFPNIRTLHMDSVSYKPNKHSVLGLSCWPSLDHVYGEYHYPDMWRVTCPVHHLELSSGADVTSRNKTQSEAANFLRAVEDMSPVVLTMDVHVDYGPELWSPLVTVVPRLVCLCLELRLEGSLGAPLLTWIETVPPILASLQITFLEVYVEASYSLLLRRSRTSGTRRREFNFFRAVVQIFPATLAKSITSLKYLSFATFERGKISHRNETNAWWRLSKTEGKRVMEPFSTSEGDTLLERLRSEPGADSASL